MDRKQRGAEGKWYYTCVGDDIDDTISSFYYKIILNYFFGTKYKKPISTLNVLII